MTQPFVRKPSKADILTAVVRQTGLDRNTVKDLLKKGWSFNPTQTENEMTFSKKLGGSRGL